MKWNVRVFMKDLLMSGEKLQNKLNFFTLGHQDCLYLHEDLAES